MSEPMPDTLADLINLLHTRIGRNLLRYQSVELSFKAAGPYLVRSGETNDAASVRRTRERLSGQTLGALAGELGPILNIPQGYLDISIDRIVESRNQLVHHFMEPGARDLTTEAGVRAAILYLDRQYEEAKEIAQLADNLNAVVLIARVQAMPARDQELELLLQQVVERIPENVELISHGDPSRTLWRTTRVVQLLQRAERETESFNGLTLLSRAGEFIRKNDPDLHYTDYGLDKLSHIVAASGLFELFEISGPDGNAGRVVYRSR